MFKSSRDCSFTQTSPPEKRSMVESTFIRVDLPDPEGPITAVNSPAAMVRSRFLNTGVLP
ncbi:hypothetical protein D3C81_2288530 [compost metagenome]